MRLLKMTVSTLAGGLLLAGSQLSQADSAKTDTANVHPAPAKAGKVRKHVTDGDGQPIAADNTGTNKRDRDDGEKTADDQKNAKSDLDLTAEIRRVIVKDKDLSTNAHNVKIIVQNGKVTLKGPVASKTERATVEKKAADIAGANKVVNEMAVAP